MGKSALTHEPETYMIWENYRAWAEQQSGGRFGRHRGRWWLFAWSRSQPPSAGVQ